MTKEICNRFTGLIEFMVWFLFAVALAVAVWPGGVQSVVSLDPYIAIDGLTRVIWPYVTLLTGIILRFSRRYMAGNHRLGYFFLRCLRFLGAVMVLSATNHMVVFAVCWLMMGWLMAGMISHKIDWPQARAAGRLALMYFLSGSLFLFIGLTVLYAGHNSLDISEVMDAIRELPAWSVYVAFFSLLISVTIQSALFPVQDWLMSSMTAPTPASALMHAGFVNAGGILLTTFAPLFADQLVLMGVLVGVGAISALMGNIWKLVQSAVKRQLGCSTVAQMGFMILQCGLGFFSAAITHLILHGFFKGYLFLSCGNAIEQTARSNTTGTRSRSWGVLMESLLTALAAGGLFIVLTGKGTTINSGIVLTFIVVMAVLHGTREFVNRERKNGIFAHLLFPLIALFSTALYSGIYLGITALMSDVPMATKHPTPFTWFHGVLMAVFMGSYLITELKLYTKFPRLYVYILNASQPHHDTIISSRDEYDV